MHTKNILITSILIFIILFISACNNKKTTDKKNITNDNIATEVFRPGGGSSGMEQISNTEYMAVYDLKNFEEGYRMGLIEVTLDALKVTPLKVNTWDGDDISSDLESICAVPGREGEFLMAESGNWEGLRGRIFHVKVNTTDFTADIMGSVKIPQINRNDHNLVGDQYEAMLCLPYDSIRRVVVLGERGGSEANPNGIIRWGVLDLESYSFAMNGAGLEGKKVEAPGNWKNIEEKRDITDFHVDSQGVIWAGACEDQGDMGPFYSVVYKLGMANYSDKDNPVVLFKNFNTFKEVNGFKVEALSGPCEGIQSTHSIGTEDEIYGGVWRPLNIM